MDSDASDGVSSLLNTSRNFHTEEGIGVGHLGPIVGCFGQFEDVAEILVLGQKVRWPK